VEETIARLFFKVFLIGMTSVSSCSADFNESACDYVETPANDVPVMNYPVKIILRHYTNNLVCDLDTVYFLQVISTTKVTPEGTIYFYFFALR
jgi:hypothetical protein